MTPEERKIYNKEYRKNNLEKMNAASKLWQEQNPDKVKEHQRLAKERRKADTKSINLQREYYKQWLKQNPDKLTAYRNKRNAEREGNLIEARKKTNEYVKGWRKENKSRFNEMCYSYAAKGGTENMGKRLQPHELNIALDRNIKAIDAGILLGRTVRSINALRYRYSNLEKRREKDKRAKQLAASKKRVKESEKIFLKCLEEEAGKLVWKATGEMRWHVWVNKGKNEKLTLQQRWMNKNGEAQWRDVPMAVDHA